MNVKVYSTPTCPFCLKAKEYLIEKKIKFENIDVASNDEARNEMVEKSGQMGVPVIIVTKDDGSESIVVGFDQAELDKALA